jgi:hypothetical protein
MRKETPSMRHSTPLATTLLFLGASLLGCGTEEEGDPELETKSSALIQNATAMEHLIVMRDAKLASTVRHTLRFPNGAWTDYADPGKAPGILLGVEAELVGTEGTHVVQWTTDGAFHRLRYPNGAWSGSWGSIYDTKGTGVHVTGIGLGSVTNSAGQAELHVCMVHAGRLWHRVRLATANGDWTPFQQPSSMQRTDLKDVDCTGSGRDLEVTVIANNGGSGAIFTTVATPLGWGFALPITGSLSTPGKIATTTIDGITHYLVTTLNDNRLYHRMSPGHDWQIPVTAQTGSFMDVSAANVLGNLNVMALSASQFGGTPFHAILSGSGWGNFIPLSNVSNLNPLPRGIVGLTVSGSFLNPF